MRRQLAIGFVIALAATFAYWQFTRLAGAQTPRVYFDSQAYVEIAQRPLGLAQWFYAKPPFVPLIYRATSDPSAIRVVQVVVALVAWTTFAFALGLALRRGWVRALAAGVAIAFLLAAPRIGWTGAMLSESINDSLLALVVAGGLALAVVRHPGTRIAVAIATGALGLAWIFTRDTNAITALVAIATAAIVWPAWRWSRRAVAFAALAAAAASFTLWSTRVVPEPLPFQQYWAPELTARGAYPMVDNLLIRVLADDRAWLAERGAPVAELDRLRDVDKLVQHVPENAAAQAWIVTSGAGTYARWLLRHPIDRIAELGGDWVAILAARHTQSMPVGWVSYDRERVALELVRRLTTNRWVVLALLLASPLLLRRPRRDPRVGLALGLVVSGGVAAAAAYYGDAVELSRHCYGSGQQIVIGLFLAALVWLDRVRRK